MMKTIEIDASQITDWNSFHRVFKEKFGFPNFYGENMSAWIDCMTYIDDPDAGMSTTHVVKGDTLLLKLVNTQNFLSEQKEILDTLLEVCAEVNMRKVQEKSETTLAVAY